MVGSRGGFLSEAKSGVAGGRFVESVSRGGTVKKAVGQTVPAVDAAAGRRKSSSSMTPAAPEKHTKSLACSRPPLKPSEFLPSGQSTLDLTFREKIHTHTNTLAVLFLFCLLTLADCYPFCDALH